MFELLLGLRQAIMRLIKATERQLGIHGLGINLNRLLEIHLGLIGQIGSKLKQGEQ